MTMRTWIPAALLALVVAIPPTGCDSENSICGPGTSVALLAGHVRTGADPAACTLEAWGIDPPDGVMRLIRGHPENDGTYSLAVPAGRYTLNLKGPNGVNRYYSRHAGPVTYSLRDTLTVENGHTLGSLDFDLGALHVQINLPDPGLAGTKAGFELHRQNPDAPGWIESFHSQSVVMTSDGATLRADGIRPGRYQVELEIGESARYSEHHGGERVWLPDADGPDQAAWYTVTAGSARDLSFAVANSSAHLTGRIGGAWLELGLKDLPLLSVVDEDSNFVIDSWQVENDGAFALDLRRPRPVRLLITQSGMARYVGGHDFAAATVFNPQPDQTISGIEAATCAITVDLAASWTGGYFQPKFAVYTEDGSTRLGAMEESLVNGAIFVLPNLWPGAFMIRVRPADWDYGLVPWLDQWYPGVLDLALAEPVALAEAGQILSLDMALQVGGTISGRILGVQDANGYRYLVVTTADDPETWGHADVWGSDMAYRILGLPDGRYRIGQASSSHATDTIWYPGTPDWDAAEVITIEDAGTVAGIDIPLEGNKNTTARLTR